MRQVSGSVDQRSAKWIWRQIAREAPGVGNLRHKACSTFVTDGVVMRSQIYDHHRSAGAMIRRATYTGIAKGLHWGVALGVLILITLGLVMTRADLGLELTVALYQLHKSFGCAVFLLMLCRVLWRARHVPPAWPPDMPRWQQRAAHVMHATLYLLLLALPFLGWLMVSAAPIPFPTTVFGLFDVPHLAALARLQYEQRLPWSELLTLLHRGLAWLLTALVIIHAAVAIVPSARNAALLGRMSRSPRRSQDADEKV
jgi:cytochrome b561